MSIDEIRARHNAATPGPYYEVIETCDEEGFCEPYSYGEIKSGPEDEEICTCKRPMSADSNAIAYSWQDIDDLLAEVDRLTAKLNEANDQIEWDNRLVKDLTTRLEQAEKERDRAVECIIEVEYSLANSRFVAAWAEIRKWRGAERKG